MTVMQLAGLTVVVVGLGKSGIAAARLCQRRGANVIGTDTRRNVEGTPPGVALRLGEHDLDTFAGADLVVVSPGVPPLPVLDRVRDRGTEVIGEVELACRFVEAPIVAVGGTNGKSTTTTLAGNILHCQFDRVFVGGNLGDPLADVVDGGWDVLVLEVSSFQLERVAQFRPKVSVLLNVTEDHLDRYADFDAYADAKGNAFLRQQASDTAVVPVGDALCERQARRGGGSVVTFGKGGDFDVDGPAVVERATATTYSIDADVLVGRHNWTNAAAAIAAARHVGAEPDAVRRGLAAFRPLRHRLERVAAPGPISYFDDSKATNVDAAATAVAGMPQARVVLIAGGRDKLGDYMPLVEALAAKQGAAVLIGEAAGRIAEACHGRVEVELASDMAEAVRTASGLARPGDAVLLSPACSSFDMFQSYADRGEKFVEAVRAFTKGVEP